MKFFTKAKKTLRRWVSVPSKPSNDISAYVLQVGAPLFIPQLGIRLDN